MNTLFDEVTAEQETKIVGISEVVFRKDLYPRINHQPGLVQRYAENLDLLPPIEVNQNNELIDGWHRWTAHKEAKRTTITVSVTETESDADLLELAIERNAAYGLQLSMADKKEMAQTIYKNTPIEHTAEKKRRLAQILSVVPATIQNWLATIDEDRTDRRNVLIYDMWLSCHTQEEIAEAVGLTQRAIGTLLEQFLNLEIVLKVPEFDHLPDEERFAANAARSRDLMSFEEAETLPNHSRSTRWAR